MAKTRLIVAAVLSAVLTQPLAAQTVADPGLSDHATVADPAPATAPAATSGGIGEIVVTAQRRRERSVDVPISITALSAEALERSNANQLTDISKIAPALRFDNAGPFIQPSIRGVGTPITTSGGGPNVGIYVDGFLIPNPQSAAFELINVESIQVLKGPQGTLFGRNTTGGAILVTTAEPQQYPSLKAKASYGRFNEQKYQAYATAGISKDIAFDVEGLLHKGDNYFTNILDGDNKVGAFQNWTVRAGLKVNFTPDLSLLLRYTHSRTDDPTQEMQNAFTDVAGNPLVYKAIPASLIATRPGEVAISATQPASFKQNADAYQATLRADLAFANLASYTQYRAENGTYQLDLDETGADIFALRNPVKNDTFTQEILLTSKPGGRLQWTAGLYYFWNKDIYTVGLSAFGGAFTPSGSGTDTASYAGFVDATYEVVDRLFLTGGVRYSHDKVSNAYFIVPGVGTMNVDDYTSSRVTPRAVIRFELTNNSSIYASYTKGFKAGLLNVGGNSTARIRPEDMNAYEAGYKYSARGLSFDIASFYYDYKNLQVSSFQNGQAQIRNAASSKIYGVEGQVRYRVLDGLDVNAGAAYVHANYKRFRNAPFIVYCTAGVNCGFLGAGSFAQIEGDASGQTLQRSPRFTANAGASYEFELGHGKAVLGSNLYYTTKVYFDPAAQFAQGGYALVSLKADWTDPNDRFTLGVYGENVSGKRYRTGGNFSTLGIGAVWSAPATYGVSVGVKF